MVILASVRPQRRGTDILHWWLETTARTARSAGARIEVADLREWDLPLGQEPLEPHTGRYSLDATRRWAGAVRRADAFVVITPEHNHSLPASLKNAFDLLGPEWASKPVAWVSYGNTSAGTRALVAAKQVATTLGMASVGPDVSLRLADLGEGGQLADDSRGDAAVRALVALVQQAATVRAVSREPLRVPGIAPGDVVHRGDPRDAAELLTLQRACWVDEAVANQTLDIPALHEDLSVVEEALGRHQSLMVRRGGRLIASVQCWQDGPAWWIGRLMVAPDHRRRGLARALLRHAQDQAPGTAERICVNTGAASALNRRLYESEGFLTDDTSVPGVVRLAKQRPTTVRARPHRTPAAAGTGSQPLGTSTSTAGP